MGLEYNEYKMLSDVLKAVKEIKEAVGCDHKEEKISSASERWK